MNKVQIFLTVFAVMIAVLGCGGRGSGGSQEVDGVITMTTEIQEVTLYLTGYGEATIDWGDGSQPEVVELNEMPDGFAVYVEKFRYRRSYPNQEQRIITISGNITLLICSDNQLTALDVSRAQTLIRLDCRGNGGIRALDVSQNAALRILQCGENGFTALDVSRNTALSMLICDKNQLTALDISRNTALTYLGCSNNRLTELDVSRNTALLHLDCWDNQLTALNVSENVALEILIMSDNQFTDEALNALFNTLHGNGGEISISGNPGSADCDPSIAEAKGWTVEGFTGIQGITFALDFGFKVTIGNEEDFETFKTYMYFKLERNNNVIFEDNSLTEYEFGDKRYPIVLQTGNNSFEALFEVNSRPGKNYLKRLFVNNDKLVEQDELPVFEAEATDINNDGIKEYAGQRYYSEAWSGENDMLVSYNPFLYYSVMQTGLKLDSLLTKQRNEMIYGTFHGFQFSNDIEPPIKSSSVSEKIQQELKLIRNE